MKNITTYLLSIFLCGSILHACSSSDKTLIPPSPNFEEEEIKEITLPEDIQIIPVGGKASECQPGSLQFPYIIRNISKVASSYAYAPRYLRFGV